jgi:hypothetical protein
MAANNTTTSNLTCFTSYDTDGFAAVIGIRVAISILSLVCCIIMVLLIFLFQKYQFFTQRLILYLCLATLAYSIVSIVNVEGYKAYRDPVIYSYCIFTGFLEQVIVWWVLLASTCIMVDVFVKVMFNKMTERLEIPYVIITFASPLTIAWLPFINLAYGPSGAWCWIRSVEYDCTFFLYGTLLRFIVYYGPLYILMAVLLVMLVIVLVKLTKQRKSWTGMFDPATLEAKKRMRKEVIPLLAYPIIFLVVNIPPLINRITNIALPNEPVLPLWIISVFCFSLQGVIITFAFALDPETRKNLTPKHIAGAFKRLIDRKGEVQEYNIQVDDNSCEPEIEQSTVIADNDEF